MPNYPFTYRVHSVTGEGVLTEAVDEGEPLLMTLVISRIEDDVLADAAEQIEVGVCIWSCGLSGDKIKVQGFTDPTGDGVTVVSMFEGAFDRSTNPERSTLAANHEIKGRAVAGASV